MRNRAPWFLGVLVAWPGFVRAQEDESDLEARVTELERENEELQRRIDVIAEEQERLELGELVPPIGASQWGLGPAASKVYGVESGISLGGYGEALYRFSNRSDEFDFLRGVLYVGYRFDEHWVFNSEIEYEHASTGEEGEVSLEFAYLDWLNDPALNARAGLVLIPMGFLNELHEPTTFLSATRPETERRIIPSTWREMGAGVFGDAGPISYRTYIVNGFDATGFEDTGLRGGRQDGSKAKAEDLAIVARADWTDTPGLLAGGSVYYGDSGQDQAGLGGTGTSIYEVHAEWKARGLWLRGLFAHAEVDDVTQLNNALGFVGNKSVGEELEGWYVEAGYDIWALIDPEAPAAVRPYVRYERVDTQVEVPTGFASSPANDFDVVTVGINVQPIDQLAFKLEYQDFETAADGVNLSVGYAF